MTLKKLLRDNGYDLIDGPVRNQKLLQLWLKKFLKDVDFYYAHVSHAFNSNLPLDSVTNPALNVNFSHKDEYSFNIGVTFLEEILKSIGLGNLELSAKVTTGKKVTVSYNNSKTEEVPLGPLTNFFLAADFSYPNPILLRNANRNDILIISGVVLAKDLKVEIETDLAVNVGLVAELNQIANGKANFAATTNNVITMTSSDPGYMPIAVKAHQLQYHKGEFVDIKHFQTDFF